MTNPNRKRMIALIVFGLISVLVFAACKPKPVETPDVQPYPGGGEVVSPGMQYPEAVEESAPLDSYPDPEMDDPQDEPIGEVDYPAPEIEPSTLKTELEATNPKTVSLASGQIQLVEFFAFW